MVIQDFEISNLVYVPSKTKMFETGKYNRMITFPHPFQAIVVEVDVDLADRTGIYCSDYSNKTIAILYNSNVYYVDPETLTKI